MVQTRSSLSLSIGTCSGDPNLGYDRRPLTVTPVEIVGIGDSATEIGICCCLNKDLWQPGFWAAVFAVWMAERLLQDPKIFGIWRSPGSIPSAIRDLSVRLRGLHRTPFILVFCAYSFILWHPSLLPPTGGDCGGMRFTKTMGQSTFEHIY